MKASAVVPAPGSGTEAEALIKEARRRQRRRYAVTGLAVAAVLASVLGAFAGLHGASQPPSARPPAGRPRPKPAVSHPAGPQAPGPIPRSVDSTVLMWPVGPGQAGGIYLDKLRTRHLRLAPAPSMDPGEYQPIMPAGRWVIYVVSNGVSAVPSEVKGAPRVLGKTLLFGPAATPGHVWLQYGFFGRGPNVVRLVRISDGQAGPPIVLSGGTQLIAGTEAGLLLSGRYGSPLQLWNPGTAPSTLPHSVRAEGFDVTRQLIAYNTGCRDEETAQSLSYEADAGFTVCRMLRVFDVVTGRLRSFAAPPGTVGWIANHGGFVNVSAIARSGTMMAADAVIPPDDHGRVRAFVLRLTGPHRRPAAVPSSTGFLWAATAWSASGSWLFYQGPGQHMWAYQVLTGKVRSSMTPCCQYAVMGTVKSPPG